LDFFGAVFELFEIINKEDEVLNVKITKVVRVGAFDAFE